MRSRARAMIVCAVLSGAVHAQDGPYRPVKEIAVGGEGGWDYLSVDPAAHRLYVSHATRVVVIDTRTDKLIRPFACQPIAPPPRASVLRIRPVVSAHGARSAVSNTIPRVSHRPCTAR